MYIELVRVSGESTLNWKHIGNFLEFVRNNRDKFKITLYDKYCSRISVNTSKVVADKILKIRPKSQIIHLLQDYVIKMETSISYRNAINGPFYISEPVKFHLA